MSFGVPHRHFGRTDSTNTRARELAAAGAPHGTVVTAAEQTAGRGRQGRTWSAPAGGALLYSAVVRPLAERHDSLPLAVPIAVCEAAERLRPGIGCGVKWPNDVQVDGRKLAGVLIEARPRDGWAVLGVGLNVRISRDQFPAELRETATSLFPGPGDTSAATSSPVAEADPQAPPRTLSPSGRQKAEGPGTAAWEPGAKETKQALDEALGRWVGAGTEAVLEAWQARDALRGRPVSWDGGSGVAAGIDGRGYLLVLTPAGDRVAIGAGEVHLSVG